MENKPIPIVMLTDTLPEPTIEFECLTCKERMTKQLFSHNGKTQYKLTCKDGISWIQI